MRLRTVVEDYVFAAMELAEATHLEDGSYVAAVPGFPGIVACGADVHECQEELFRLLEEWTLVSLVRGFRLPALETSGGMIDLNLDPDRILTTYDPIRVAAIREDRRPYYRDEAELEDALDRLDGGDASGLTRGRPWTFLTRQRAGKGGTGPGHPACSHSLSAEMKSRRAVRKSALS